MGTEELYQDIPDRFHSFETGKPFERCIECDTYLLDGKEYIIEKAIRQYPGYSAKDTIFDYAICMDCAMKMRQEFSKESISKIDAFFEKGFIKFQLKIREMQSWDVDQCLEKCLINEDKMNKLDEYQIYAYCKGDKLFRGVPPYMVGGPAVDQILELLSNATIDFLNGFYNKHFSPDPSLVEPTPSPKLVFV